MSRIASRFGGQRNFPARLLLNACQVFLWLMLIGIFLNASAAEPVAAQTNAATLSSSAPDETDARFDIRRFVLEVHSALPTNDFESILSKQAGTNIGVQEIVQAASEVQAEYSRRGHPGVSIAIAKNQIKNGVVKLLAFPGTSPQILISGKNYLVNSNTAFAQKSTVLPAIASAPVSPKPPLPTPPVPQAVTAAPEPPEHLYLYLGTPVSSNQMHEAETALQREMVVADRQDRRRHLLPNSPTNPVTSTNGPFFEVKGYELTGNTLLPKDVTDLIFEPYTGTNVTFDTIRQALVDLRTVYIDRGFPTVSVGLPQQTLTNGIVKVSVTEGTLSQINVANAGPVYFSSNNVMRALPSLRPGILLTNPIFQAELDRANANQDRQIYPQVEPGPTEGTTVLRLDVRDQLPLHGKVELNNQSTPGTPDMRVDTSVAYNNLWQREHSLGLQYAFSPETYKQGKEWQLYDQPLVANYSGFYRFPIGDQESLADDVAAKPGNFGYNEATRKFELPSPSGRPEINIYASRSTIDTGVEKSPKEVLFNVPGVREVTRSDAQQDLTKNESLGFRLTQPLPDLESWKLSVSPGADFKIYRLNSFKTNVFAFTDVRVDSSGHPTSTNTTAVPSAVPATFHSLMYLPLTAHFDASKRDASGVTSFGIGLTVNAWHSGPLREVQNLSTNSHVSGRWVTLNPSLTRDIIIHTNWTLSLHTEGQWASEPLISNEQMGFGGVSSVRGYEEGEVFGDTGWRANAELKSPGEVIGMVYGKQPLLVRGSLYTDYAEVFSLNPELHIPNVALWGVGFGTVMSVGSHWEARLLFSWPLLSTTVTKAGNPRFNFGISGQF
ncbi:MAG TPA: POTRA domain-containing protein [Verrucomicrobiae bacterium]|jgi:hemolysin activation/secretion protein|nr:POTRA domain-containing protein [Verrucomicrobiae bacterium]